jgi:thioredoxin 1
MADQSIDDLLAQAQQMQSEATPVRKLNDATYDDAVKARGVVMVDFYSDSCPPCRALAPIVEQVAKDYLGQVETYKVNVDYSRKTAAKNNIEAVPTLIFYLHGELAARRTGLTKADDIKGILNQLL